VPWEEVGFSLSRLDGRVSGWEWVVSKLSLAESLVSSWKSLSWSVGSGFVQPLVPWLCSIPDSWALFNPCSLGFASLALVPGLYSTVIRKVGLC
jgi:hypothetical protein